MRVWARFGGQVVRKLATILLVAICAAMLIRFAPGFGVDERELDAHLGQESREAIRSVRNQDRNLFAFFGRLISEGKSGNLGFSVVLNRPVREILRDRFPVTAVEISFGLSAAGVGAMLLAITGYLSRHPIVTLSMTAGTGLLLCLPAAVMGYLGVWFRLRTEWILAATVFPHLFRCFSNLLDSSRESPHVEGARARGIKPWRLHVHHVLLPCVPEALAAFGVSGSLAFGASIPIECATNTHGVGELAWLSASARDLPVLFSISVLVGAFVFLVNAGADGLRWLAGEPETLP